MDYKKWNCDNPDMPKYGNTGMTCDGFQGKRWETKEGDRVIRRNNHHPKCWGWIVVSKKLWSKEDFPDPILVLQHDDGTTITSSSSELVKEEDWLHYYGQSDLKEQPSWVGWKTLKSD